MKIEVVLSKLTHDNALSFFEGGLTDTELEDVVSCNDTVLNDLLSFETPPPGKIVRLPSLLWRRLKYDLKPYVVERQRDGKTVLFWSHDIFVTGKWLKYIYRYVLQ